MAGCQRPHPQRVRWPDAGGVGVGSCGLAADWRPKIGRWP